MKILMAILFVAAIEDPIEYKLRDRANRWALRCRRAWRP